VTVAAYKRFVAATHRTMPPESAGGFTTNPGWRNEKQPITDVTWDEASAYCGWAGGTLPTEAQWEYAARAGAASDPYGPLDEIAWTARNSGRQPIDADKLFETDKPHYEETLKSNGNGPHDVGQKRPNAFGLFDMIGNAVEWTHDWADLTYYSHSPAVDPPGPATGQARVLKGGHFLYPSAPNRASKRLWDEPGDRSPLTGFRCVLPR
jgi:formylglycine-generating enzyme required for sulfatase activity